MKSKLMCPQSIFHPFIVSVRCKHNIINIFAVENLNMIFDEYFRRKQAMMSETNRPGKGICLDPYDFVAGTY